MTMAHLGWFTSFRPPLLWNPAVDPLAGNLKREWQDGSFLIEHARAAERAKLDVMLLEDNPKVPDAYGNSFEGPLRSGSYLSGHDPIPLAGVIAAATKNIGLQLTSTTSYQSPYNVARAFGTLAHVSHGRVGWNIVTGSGNRAAQNYGLLEQTAHDKRYDIADEFVEVVQQLWASWDEDALDVDPSSERYAREDSIHTIDYAGEYFNVRGPLNVEPSGYGTPVLSQAGSSPRGRQFGGRWGELILAESARGIESMKQFREEIRSEAERNGRNPDDLKVMYIIDPIIGRTEDEAKRKLERRQNPSELELLREAVLLSSHSEVDCSQFAFDEPLPDLTTEGHQGPLETFKRLGNTFGEILTNMSMFSTMNGQLVGTSEQVAEKLGEILEEVGGDGFMFHQQRISRDYIHEITDGLVPAMQRRGLSRTEYASNTLRGNLTSF